MLYSKLLETDQVGCYSESGVELPCTGSGQDGETRGRRLIQKTRFKVRDGVVADRLTGLRWNQNASPATFPMSWSEAFEYTDQLNQTRHLGIANWRLPSRRELFSLISHQYVNPALPQGHPFADVFSGYYWTASACRRLDAQAWYIHLGGGRVYRGLKANSYMVWPVAAPPPADRQSKKRFVIEKRIARDRLTKRVWLKPCEALRQPVKWEQALAAVDDLNANKAAGYSDWRLPNIRELESLVDLRRHSPALPADHPFGDVAEGYWSSTTSTYEKRYGWVLYPRDGAVGVGYKPLPEFCVWVVRSDPN